MLRLFKAEWFKLRKNRTFFVLTILSCLLGIVLLTATFVLKDVIKDELSQLPKEQQEVFLKQISGGGEEGEPYIVPQVGYALNPIQDPFNPEANEVFYVSFGSGLVTIFLCALIGSFIAKEYTSGTIKNIIAYGNSRTSYYLNKFIALTVGTGIITFILVSIPTTLATFIYGWGESFTSGSIVKMVTIFISFLIVNMSIISLLMLLATLIKSNGAVIGIGLAIFVFIPMIISALYGKYEWFDFLYRLTPDYNLDVVQTPGVDTVYLVKAIGTSLLTTIVTLGAGVYLFKKQDIK